MKNLLILLSLAITINSCSFMEKQDQQDIQNKTLKIDFWSGNRSAIRQDYEREVLMAVLKSTEKKYGQWHVTETKTAYPGNEESQVFTTKNHDVFVTIAGNQKFDNEEYIMIGKPISKNLLGYRIPIIKSKNKDKFNTAIQNSELKKLVHGIPETWGDAIIFRQNDYAVAEEGSFDDIFERLYKGNFDYTTFGANEVLSVYKNRAALYSDLVIEESLMFYYPFPLVFYINPKKTKLAKRLSKGLDNIEKNKTLDSIFYSYYKDIIRDLQLNQRKIITLDNPLISEEFINLKPDLLRL